LAIGDNLLVIGMIFLFLGIVLVFASSIFLSKDKNVKFAGGVMVGPFPVFGAFSDKSMFWVLITLFVIGIILWIVLRKSVI